MLLRSQRPCVRRRIVISFGATMRGRGAVAQNAVGFPKAIKRWFSKIICLQPCGKPTSRLHWHILPTATRFNPQPKSNLIQAFSSNTPQSIDDTTFLTASKRGRRPRILWMCSMPISRFLVAIRRKCWSIGSTCRDFPNGESPQLSCLGKNRLLWPTLTPMAVEEFAT